MSGRHTQIVGWCACLSVALYLRLSAIVTRVVGDEVASNGPDTAYHTRRMLQAWADYPRVPLHDPLLDWPNGAVAPWPQGFDVLVATFALPADERIDALILIALAPVFLGLLLVLLTGWAMRRVLPDAPSWALLSAAMVVAMVPQAVSVSSFANPDHHIAEALSMLLLGLGAHAIYIALDERRFNWMRRAVAELGIAFGSSVALWLFVGSSVYVAIAALVVVIANLRWGHGNPLHWAVGAPGLVLGAGLVEWAYSPLIDAHGHAFSYVYPSHLQPVLLGVAAIGCAAGSLLGALAAGGARRGATGAAALALVIGPLVFAGVSSDAAAELQLGIREWFGDELLTGTSEAVPMFSGGWARAYRYYGIFGLLAPLLVPGGLLAYARRVGGSRALPLVAWTVCICALALYQNRFGRLALVNLALCTSMCMVWLADTAKRHGHLVALAPALALVVDPAFHHYMRLGTPRPLPPEQEAGVFLRENTPAPQLGERSGVLTGWDQGHYLVRYAERPVTANGFGFYVGKDAYREVKQLWQRDEKALLEFMQERDLGYVAQGASKYEGIRLHGRGPFLSGAGGPIPNPEFFARLPLATLILGGSGSAHHRVSHLRRLMPRFASSFPSKGMPASVPALWVYERVAGARIRGRAKPGTIVRLRTALQMRGRPAGHEAWAVADAAGTFELITPMPTDYRAQGLETAQQALLQVDKAPPVQLAIPEEAVRAGRTLDAPGGSNDPP